MKTAVILLVAIFFLAIAGSSSVATDKAFGVKVAASPTPTPTPSPSPSPKPAPQKGRVDPGGVRG